MDFIKLDNFSEIKKNLFKKSFSRDSNSRLFLHVTTSMEGIKFSLENKMGIGFRKLEENHLRIILTFSGEKGESFAMDLDLSIDDYKKTILSYINQDKQYIAFLYKKDGKYFYGYSKAFKINEEQKKEVGKMLEDGYPVIHKIPLSEFKLDELLNKKYFLYEVEKNKYNSIFLKKLLIDSLNKEKRVALWFEHDDKKALIFSSKKISNKNITLKKKNTDPLDYTALPFGITGRENDIFLIAVDKKGIEEIIEKSGNKSYEKKFNFWN